MPRRFKGQGPVILRTASPLDFTLNISSNISSYEYTLDERSQYLHTYPVPVNCLLDFRRILPNAFDKSSLCVLVASKIGHQAGERILWLVELR